VKFNLALEGGGRMFEGAIQISDVLKLTVLSMTVVFASLYAISLILELFKIIFYDRDNKKKENMKKENKKEEIINQTTESVVDLEIYEVGKELARNKIIYANDMNTEAIVAKLMWALGKSENIDDVKKLVETPVMGDCCY